MPNRDCIPANDKLIKHMTYVVHIFSIIFFWWGGGGKNNIYNYFLCRNMFIFWEFSRHLTKIYTKTHQTALYFQNFLGAASVIHGNMFSKISQELNTP